MADTDPKKKDSQLSRADDWLNQAIDPTPEPEPEPDPPEQEEQENKDG